LEEHVAAFTVHQGKRYRASISLGMLESFASNDTIAERLQTAGFIDISVSGVGRTRIAEALWRDADATAELPKQITEVVEL
jgi:hypothetical protein